MFGETMSTQDRRFAGQKLHLYIHLTDIMLAYLQLLQPV